jgi:hypothetical protein
MSCQEVEDRLTDLFDRRLAASDEIRLHAHLEGCAMCRDRAALWNAMTPEMRRLAPPRPAPLALRRMEVVIERALAETAAAPRRRWRWSWPWRPATSLALAGAAAAAVVAVAVTAQLTARHAPPAGADRAAPFATVERLSAGAAAAAGDSGPLRAGARLPAGAGLSVPEGGSLALALAGRAAIVVDGPARLVLLGDPSAVRLRLEHGKLTADVSKRRADESFVVELGDVRAEVRGTRFEAGRSVTGARADSASAWVTVFEGRVAVSAPGRSERMVSAGETFTVAPQAAAAAQEPTPGDPAALGAPALDCPDRAAAPRPSCQTLARRARAAMRARRYPHALAVADEGLASAAGGPAGCPAPVLAPARAACLDDLRYLRAEALRLDGRLDQAAATYRALDRVSAPAAMRQNALYAAGQIEQRRGRPRVALADFERALAVAPRGALREEAMLGAMETAAALGEGDAARAAARRYLAGYPDGRGAAAARRLAGGAGSASSGPASHP